MLTRIDVLSENAFFVPILGVTPKDSLLIRKITGLNPPDLNLFIGDYSRDGGVYQGRRVGQRNVVLTMDLNPNPALGETVAGLREMLYKAFVDPLVDADHIKLVLYDDTGLQRYLVGYTEKFETELFEVETMVQISILCPDPYIRDNVETVYTEPLGNGWVEVPFTYGGTSETGFEAEIKFTANTPMVVLSNNPVTDDPASPNYNRGRMIVTHPFLTTDLVYFNTTAGSRDIKLAKISDVTPELMAMDITTRWTMLEALGKTTPLVYKLSPYSRWLELHSQANVMKVHGITPDNIVAAVNTLSYTAAYWGI